MGSDDSISTRWITWPAAAIAALAFGTGRIVPAAFLDLIVVAALAWLGGWFLSDLAYRYLARRGELPRRGHEDEWLLDEPGARPRVWDVP